MCMTLKSQLVDLNNNNNEFCVIEGINNNNEENVEYIWKKNALTKDFYCILDYIYESIWVRNCLFWKRKDSVYRWSLEMHMVW